MPGPGGMSGQGGIWSRGVPARGGVPALGGSGPGEGLVETPPPTATAAGGTHPTGMHSCFAKNPIS